MNSATLYKPFKTFIEAKKFSWKRKSNLGKLGTVLKVVIAGCTVSALYRIHGPRDLSIPIVYKVSASCIQETGQEEVATLRLKFTPTQDRKIVGFTTYRQFSLNDSFSNGKKDDGCKTLAEAINKSKSSRTSLLLEAPDYVTQLASSDYLTLSQPLKPSWLYIYDIRRGLTGSNNDLARTVIGEKGNLLDKEIQALTDDQLLEKINPTLIYLSQGTSTMRDINNALYSGTKGDFHPNFLLAFPPQK